MKLKRRCRSIAVIRVAVLLACPALALAPVAARAAVLNSRPSGVEPAGGTGKAGSSLEAAAARAGNTGRAVAMSLIGLAFAVAGTVLAFRRDFKEATGVFAVGIVSILLATPTGVTLLKDTVTTLFGGP